MNQQTINGDAAMNRALAEIGREDGLELRLNDDGVCLIEIEGRVPLVLELTANDELALCHVVLGSLSDDYNERYLMMQAALQSNLRLPSMVSGAVALDPTGGTLVLTTPIPLSDLDGEGLRRSISDAGATADQLRAVIGVASPPDADSEAGDDSRPPSSQPQSVAP